MIAKIKYLYANKILFLYTFLEISYSNKSVGKNSTVTFALAWNSECKSIIIVMIVNDTDYITKFKDPATSQLDAITRSNGPHNGRPSVSLSDRVIEIPEMPPVGAILWGFPVRSRYPTDSSIVKSPSLLCDKTTSEWYAL